MAFDPECDGILGVGSGVINDICKVLGQVSSLQTLIVGTAPSMDGYASPTAAMEVNGIKSTLNEKAPSAVICDTEVMANAPIRMLWAGLGDMLAKSTALCEWRISSIVNNENYCPQIAELVKKSLKEVETGAEGITSKNVDSVKRIAEGLVLSGICMCLAGNSRPASGLEHYFSHCWEMMCLSRGKQYDLHGIQVGIGTLITLRLYEKLKTITPTVEHAQASADAFDSDAWANNLRKVLPKIAPELIEMEKTAGKNEKNARMQRVRTIINNWETILQIINELPSYNDVTHLMKKIGMPTLPQEIGYSTQDTVDAFVCSRDVRKKYLTSSLIWDLGYMDEFVDFIRELYE